MTPLNLGVEWDLFTIFLCQSEQHANLVVTKATGPTPRDGTAPDFLLKQVIILRVIPIQTDNKLFSTPFASPVGRDVCVNVWNTNRVWPHWGGVTVKY